MITPDEHEANMERMRRQAAEYNARETTVTLTNQDWHVIIAAMYRAVMEDAQTLLNADEMDMDPEHVLGMISRTVEMRAKLRQAVHGNDQASWSASEAADD